MKDTYVFLCSIEYVTAVSLSATTASDVRSIYMIGMCLFVHETLYHFKQSADWLTKSLDTCVYTYVCIGGRSFSTFLAVPILLPRGYLCNLDPARGRQRDVQQVFRDERTFSQGQTLTYKLYDVLVITKLSTDILKYDRKLGIIEMDIYLSFFHIWEYDILDCDIFIN